MNKSHTLDAPTNHVTGHTHRLSLDTHTDYVTKCTQMNRLIYCKLPIIP